MSAGFFILAVSLLLINWQHSNLWLLAAYMVMYFGLFNYLEAAMPSALSKVATEKYRGTAMGAFSTSQFMGAFVGGAVGGYLMTLSESAVLLVMALLLILVAGFGAFLLVTKKPT